MSKIGMQDIKTWELLKFATILIEFELEWGPVLLRKSLLEK